MASFWKSEACGQTGLSDRYFDWQKIGRKCPHSKIQMRHFGLFSNTVWFRNFALVTYAHQCIRPKIQTCLFFSEKSSKSHPKNGPMLFVMWPKQKFRSIQVWTLKSKVASNFFQKCFKAINFNFFSVGKEFKMKKAKAKQKYFLRRWHVCPFFLLFYLYVVHNVFRT